MKRLILTLIFTLTFLFSGFAQNTVQFEVNTNTFIYNNNYTNFIENVIPNVQQNADNIDRILIVGSASPEGNKAWNKHLANIRADKIKSFLKEFIPYYKIDVSTDYNLFLEKTRLDESDYVKLRAVYIEVHLKNPMPPQIDTIYIKETIRDTVYITETIRDTIYIKEHPKIIPILAVKTNIAADAIITPNIQGELYTYLWGLSLEFDYTFPWWKKDYDSYFYYQILNGTAGIRKYLNNKYTGHWIGIYANTAIYDICFWNKDKGHQGELYGGGLGYGYVFQNKKYPRIKFEPYIRIGWFNTKFDTYHASQPWDEKYYYNWYLKASDFVPRRFNMNYFGPTEIGFNLTFDLICWRKY